MIESLKSKRGFTLIELIIVVVILGILILIVLAATRGDKSKATDQSLKADLARVQQAMEDCFVEGTGYPTSLADACVTGKFDDKDSDGTGDVPTTVTYSGDADSYTLTVTLSSGSSQVTNKQ